MVGRLIAWLSARQVRIVDVKNVVGGREFGGPDRLQQMYEWHVTRLTDVLKGIAGTIATVLTTIFFALLKKEITVHIAAWEVWLFVIAVSASAIYAAYLLWRLARIPTEYAASIQLFQQYAAASVPAFPPPWS